jgi:cyclopropane fatty-acyl-phospholipid synthase-like methyltransferase
MECSLSNKNPVSQPTQHDTDCTNCGSIMRRFFEIPQIPSNSCILMDSPEEAGNHPRGDIVLGFCDECGFIRNLAFDPSLANYSARYEETQGFSPTFRRFQEAQAVDLIKRHGLKGKKVLEIGCGKGEFLALLCSLGGNQGLGFDPGYDEHRGVLDDVEGVRVVKDFFSSMYANETADLVCCKMTLEHIQQTAEFVKLSRQAMRPDGSSVLYFQVPESMRILRDCAFQDIYYEHCSYFTLGSLSRLFQSQGFKIRHLQTEYEGQYLTVEAELANGNLKPELAYDDLASVREQVDSFPARCMSKIEEWRNRLREAKHHGSVVVWGSGSKAVAFLGAVDIQGAVDRVVDINPHRQGHYMPGTAQPIVHPDDLRQSPPNTVVAMNSVYLDEISAQLREMELDSNLTSL